MVRRGKPPVGRGCAVLVLGVDSPVQVLDERFRVKERGRQCPVHPEAKGCQVQVAGRARGLSAPTPWVQNEALQGNPPPREPRAQSTG